jgi:magnesium chelatase accessory protein
MLPRFVSWRAGRRSRFVDSLLADTGSLLSAEGVQYYRQLLQNPEHVAGALNMMASWQLETLTERLSSLNTPLLLLAGENDRTISPSQATLVSERVACATAERLPNVGHLAHEENPALLENAIFHWCLPTNKTRLCEATENSSNEN